ncbi:MAG: WD40 repeat domain-containing protein [Caldiserica bacterium]|nr:WD40 repeat domain-containing protein [Caldisericota bacterium]
MGINLLSRTCAALLLSLAVWGLPLPRGAIARLGAGYLVDAYIVGGRLWTVSSIALEEWDPDTGELERELPLPAVPELVSFSADGARVAIAVAGGRISVVTLPAGDETVTLALGEEITSLAVSPDGALIAAGGIGGKVAIWDARTGREVASFIPFDRDVGVLAFAPDGGSLAAAPSAGTELYLYDTETGERVGKFPWNQWGVRCVAFSPDGNLLAIGAGDGIVRVWDRAEHKLLRNLKGTPGPAASLSFTDAGLLVVGTSGVISRWDPDSWEAVGDLTVSGDMRYHSLAPGNTLLLHPPTGPIEIWDLNKGERTAALGRGRYLGRFTAAAFSPDGTLLAVATAEGEIRLWRTEGWEEASVLRDHRGAIDALAFAPDGTRLLSGGGDNRARIWALSDAGWGESLEVLAHAKPISDVDFSPDGRTFLTASVDETVRLWDAETGEFIRTLWKPVKVEFIQPLVRDAIYAARFSPDGRLIAAGSEDKTVRLWDAETGKLLALLRKHRDVVDCVDFSPDGTLLASGDASGTVVLWDVRRRRATAVLRRDGSAIYALAFSPDGKWLLVGGAAGTLELYSASRRALVHRLPGHVGNVLGVAFHPTGEMFVSASGDGTVLVWDLRTLSGE